MSASDEVEVPDEIVVDTKFYVETEKKKTAKQLRKALMRKANIQSRKMKKDQERKDKKQEEEDEARGDEADENEEDEEKDYGDVKTRKKATVGEDEEAPGRDSESSEYEDVEDEEDVEQVEDEGEDAEGAEKSKKRRGKQPRVIYEEGEEIEYVGHRERHAKFAVPEFEELDVFDKSILQELGLPEFETKRLQAVPYRRQVKKGKVVTTQPIKMRKMKFKKGGYLYIPAGHRDGLTPPMVDIEGEDVLYEQIPDDEMEELQDEYRKEYVKTHGGNEEDVDIPYMTPRRKIDLEKMENEDLLKLCRSRKLGCNKRVKEIVAKSTEAGDDEDGLNAKVKRGLISLIENSLVKAKVVKRRSPTRYTGTPSPARKAKRAQRNPFDPRFPIGTRVEFTDGVGNARTGRVTAFAEPGITISSREPHKRETETIKLKYTNPSLKIAAVIAKAKYIKFEDRQTVRSIYRGPVAGALRAYVRDVYKTILSDVRSIPGGEEGGSSTLVPATKDYFPMVRPGTDEESWERFYEIRFHAWRFDKFSAEVRRNLDMERIRKEAQEETERQNDFQHLLGIVFGNFDDEIDADNIQTATASDIFRGFNTKRHLTPFETAFIEDFRRRYNAYVSVEESKLGLGVYYRQESPGKYIKRQNRRGKAEAEFRKTGKPKPVTPKADRSPKQKYFPDEPARVRELVLGETDFDGKNLTGSDLAVMISESIHSYIRTAPRTEVKSIVDSEVRIGLEEAYDQEVLRAQFDRKQLAHLKTEHKEAMRMYNSEYAKYLASRASEVDINAEMEDEVRRFEQMVFDNHGNGKNTYTYLSKVLVPHLFLAGPLGKHAKFFRSKLANGMIQFHALGGANLAHYLPEFVMGVHNDAEIDALFGAEDPWVTLSQTLLMLMKVNIESFMDTYASVTDPTRRREFNNLLQLAGEVSQPVIKLLKSPTSVCESETGSGRRPVVKDGKYVYKIIGKGGSKRRVQVMEDIPEGDLVICLTDHKFSCHSIDEVIIAMAKAKRDGGKPINLQTKKPYPDSFLAKFKERYDSVGGKTVVPDDAEASEPIPKSPSPVKAKGKSTPRQKKKVERQKHKPVKGAKLRKVTGILLVGDEIEHIAGYMEEFEIPLVKGKTLVIGLTNDADDAEYEPNVAIVSFDAAQDYEEGELEDEVEKLLKQVPTGKPPIDIYVLGVGTVPKGKKSRYGLRLSKLGKTLKRPVKQIFYSENEEDDILAAFTDVVVDMEGVVPRA